MTGNTGKPISVLDWKKQFRDEISGVITADNSFDGWYILDDLSEGCWVAYYEPDDASQSENRSRIEIHRGSLANCIAACESHEPTTSLTQSPSSV